VNSPSRLVALVLLSPACNVSSQPEAPRQILSFCLALRSGGIPRNRFRRAARTDAKNWPLVVAPLVQSILGFLWSRKGYRAVIGVARRREIDCQCSWRYTPVVMRITREKSPLSR